MPFLGINQQKNEKLFVARIAGMMLLCLPGHLYTQEHNAPSCLSHRDKASGFVGFALNNPFICCYSSAGCGAGGG